MAGFYEVTKSDRDRKVIFRRTDRGSATAIYLDDAAEAKLPASTEAMPFADLVTYDADLKPSTVHMVDYDDDKGPALLMVVGQTQYSADGSTWANTIPDGVMVAGSPVNFYVRTNPAGLTRADDGSYTYNFAMASVGAGGISLINVGRNKALISGTTPLDQAGLTFHVNCTVSDTSGNTVAGTALEKDWE